MKQDRASSFWNKNLFLLWQGQLVSAMGDAVQGIALGFLVLEMTGSTAAMGLLMGLSSLPRVLVSPLAGVLIDRGSRKWFLVGADLVSGAAMLAIAFIGFRGGLNLPILAVGVLVMGVANAVFSPTVNSVIPDITPPHHLMRVNGLFQMVYAGAGILGNAVGGFLFSVVGGIGVFALNGCSYLFSSATELFLDVPEHREEGDGKAPFFSQFREGLDYLRGHGGLLTLTVFSVGVNFFLYVGLTAILPLYQRTPGFGPGKYGVTLAVFAAGYVLGSILLQFLKINPKRYHAWTLATLLISFVCLALMPIFLNIVLIYVLIFPAAVTSAISGSLSLTVNQQRVPADKRGRVLALRQALLAGSTPLAMAVSGVCAEWLEPRTLITLAFLCPFMFTPLLVRPAFRAYMNGD